MAAWINKMWYIHTIEYYSVIRNEILIHAIATMSLEKTALSEICQTQKNQYYMTPLT